MMARSACLRDMARAMGIRWWLLVCLPLSLWAVRWATTTAERAMIDQDLGGAKRAERIDRHAAAVILQAAFDRLAGGVI